MVDKIRFTVLFCYSYIIARMCGVQDFQFVATTAWIIVFFVFSTHPFLSWRIIERCVKPWVASRRHRMDIGDIVRHACGRSFPSFMLRSRRSVASRTRRTGRWSRRSLAFKRAEVARAWTAKERAKNCCQSKWSSRRRASGWHDITKSGKVWRTAKKFYITKPAAFLHMCDTAKPKPREVWAASATSRSLGGWFGGGSARGRSIQPSPRQQKRKGPPLQPQ